MGVVDTHNSPGALQQQVVGTSTSMARKHSPWTAGRERKKNKPQGGGGRFNLGSPECQEELDEDDGQQRDCGEAAPGCCCVTPSCSFGSCNPMTSLRVRKPNLHDQRKRHQGAAGAGSIVPVHACVCTCQQACMGSSQHMAGRHRQAPAAPPPQASLACVRLGGCPPPREQKQGRKLHRRMWPCAIRMQGQSPTPTPTPPPASGRA